MSAHGDSAGLIGVGDPRRPLIGRVALGTLAAAAVFFAFTATKQIKPVYVHAPWENDPYDTVFSFTMFFVPLIAACFLVQVSLCRKAEPLPTARLATIMRGCRVAVGAITIELLTAWAAVALGANRSRWSVGATGTLIALLTLATALTGKVMVDLIRAPRLPGPGQAIGAQAPDWLADLVAATERCSHWLGPLSGPGLSLLRWTDRNLLARVRAHPLVAAAVASAAFAVTVFGWQALREQYVPSVTLLGMGLGFCGMFAFLVLTGSYLGVARSPRRLYGTRRRAVDASVVACIVAIGTLAFRDSLWWIIGSGPAAAGPGQFALLVGSTTLLAFAAVFAAQALLRSHAMPPR
jgi:hypothetical protein